MRPVNLLPREVKQRQLRHGTGFAPYVVIGALVVVVVALLGYVLVQNQVTSRKNELADMTKQEAELKKKAQELSDYSKFANMKLVRVAGLTMISQSRFDWSKVLFDVSKALPDDAWLIEATGKVSKEAKTGEPGASNSGSGGTRSKDANKPDVPGPTLELVGCTYRQWQLARMMTRLRNIEGVAQVLLTTSEEKDTSEENTTGGDVSENECRVRPGIHKFTVTITFPVAPASAIVAMAAASSSAPSGQAGGQQGGTGGQKQEAGGEGQSGEAAAPPTEASAGVNSP